MSITTRVNKLEQEVSKHKKVILCVGIIFENGNVDPGSEQTYQEYLQSGIEGPFIWIRMMRPANSNHEEAIYGDKEPNRPPGKVGQTEEKPEPQKMYVLPPEQRNV